MMHGPANWILRKQHYCSISDARGPLLRTSPFVGYRKKVSPILRRVRTGAISALRIACLKTPRMQVPIILAVKLRMRGIEGRSLEGHTVSKQSTFLWNQFLRIQENWCYVEKVARCSGNYSPIADVSLSFPFSASQGRKFAGTSRGIPSDAEERAKVPGRGEYSRIPSPLRFLRLRANCNTILEELSGSTAPWQAAKGARLLRWFLPGPTIRCDRNCRAFVPNLRSLRFPRKRTRHSGPCTLARCKAMQYSATGITLSLFSRISCRRESICRDDLEILKSHRPLFARIYDRSLIIRDRDVRSGLC